MGFPCGLFPPVWCFPPAVSHAFGAKNVNLTVYSRAKVKVGPLARIRIDDEVYT